MRQQSSMARASRTSASMCLPASSAWAASAPCSSRADSQGHRVYVPIRQHVLVPPVDPHAPRVAEAGQGRLVQGLHPITDGGDAVAPQALQEREPGAGAPAAQAHDGDPDLVHSFLLMGRLLHVIPG